MKKIFLALVLLLGIAAPQHLLAAWSDYVIVLDPGHGGADPGASYKGSSVDNYTESWLALQCAGKVYNKLSSLGAKVYMTRFNDDFSGKISLTTRRNYCYTYNSDVFISFHLNAANASAHGTETWYYYSSSYSLATSVQSGLMTKFGEVNGTGGYELINRGVKNNGWTVITAGSAYPAVLTEGLFVDCYSDWQLIQDTSSKGFYAWVDGHLKGIYNYLSSKGTVTEPSYYNSGGTSDPYISASSYNVSLSCLVGDTATTQVTVDGNMINKWTTVEVVCPEEGIFSVSPTGLNVSGYTHDFDPENPTITISFTPKTKGTWGGDVDGDGYTDSFVRLSTIDTNGNDVYQWIALNGTATEPHITASSYYVELTCPVGGTATAEVTVDGHYINKWTTVTLTSPTEDIFSVSPTGLNVSGYTHDFDPENPTITITFTPKKEGTWGGDIDGDGYHDYYITLHTIGTNGEDVYQWIALKGIATPGDQPYIHSSSYRVNLTCREDQTATAQVTLDGNMINKWTTVEAVCPEEGIFSVSPTGLNVSGYTHDFDPENPTLTITFTPNKVGSWGGDVDGDGYIDSFVRLYTIDTSGNDIYQWIGIYGTSTPKPSISVSASEVNFNCNVGETETAEVEVDGNLINKWTTVDLVCSEAGIFSVTPTGLNVSGYTHDFDPENPTVTITFTPTEAGSWGGDVDGDGNSDYYIILQTIDVDGNDVYQKIELNGVAIEEPTTHIVAIENSTIAIHVVDNYLYANNQVSAIEIYSITGTLEAKSAGEGINLNDLAPGTYIVKVTDKSGFIHTAKISHSK